MTIHWIYFSVFVKKALIFLFEGFWYFDVFNFIVGCYLSPSGLFAKWKDYYESMRVSFFRLNKETEGLLKSMLF